MYSFLICNEIYIWETVKKNAQRTLTSVKTVLGNLFLVMKNPQQPSSLLYIKLFTKEKIDFSLKASFHFLGKCEARNIKNKKGQERNEATVSKMC